VVVFVFYRGTETHHSFAIARKNEESASKTIKN